MGRGRLPQNCLRALTGRSAALWLPLALGMAGCVAGRAGRAGSDGVRPERGTAEPPPSMPTAHPEPELVVPRHRVEAGETLYRIAKAYGITSERLAAANGIGDPSTLAVGQELVIPGAPEPGGESASTAAPAAVLQWPLRGVLYARFGKKGKEPHDGIDLAAPLGTPVRTAAPGRVLFAGEQPGYGLIAIVEHEQGLVTLYAHNRDLRVKTGQVVREGQVIATVGESGRTSGPHLHFEVRRQGVPVDPLGLLGPLPPP